jgi:hypothetical protein
MGWNRWARAVGLIVLCLALNAGFPARAEQHVAVDSRAEASWLVPTGRPGVYRWYLAEVRVRDLPAEGKTAEEAFVAQGRCKVHSAHGVTHIGCMGIGPGSFPHEFVIDPLGSSASLRSTTPKLDADVEWTSAPTDVDLYQAAEGCPNGHESGQGTGGGLHRLAAASGSVLGTKVGAESEYDSARMLRGVMVTECAQIRIRPTSDGNIRATASYVVPSSS